MKRNNILVAAAGADQQRIKQALSDQYRLKFVATLGEATAALCDSEIGSDSTFSMIIASVYFDESRMFELLQYVRSVDHFDKIPFLAIRTVSSEIDSMKGLGKSESVKNSLKMLGACDLLELEDLPNDEAETLLKETVRNSFSRSVERQRADRGGSQRKAP